MEVAILIIHTTNTIRKGMVRTSSRPSLTSTISAIRILPKTTSGTRVANRRLMKIISCSCVTSPVSRVIKEEDSKRLNTE
ncbi:hypothetical protein D3C87_1976710 [compost metagenome]